MTSSVVHVVDDDDLARKGTARLVGAAGFEVRTYANAQDFLSAVDPETPGCIILDIQLPDKNGLEIQLALTERRAELPIIFVTGHGQIPDTVRAMQRGAVDFLIKPVAADVLLAAVRRAVAQDAASRVARDRQREVRRRYERLTPREREVLEHLISGQLNKQVAGDLQITERTIKLHRASIFKKLEINSMVEMGRLAVDLGIDPGERNS